MKELKDLTIAQKIKTASDFETIVYALAGEPQVTMGKDILYMAKYPLTS